MTYLSSYTDLKARAAAKQAYMAYTYKTALQIAAERTSKVSR